MRFGSGLSRMEAIGPLIQRGEFGEGSTMRQTIKARYHDGVLQPLEPLVLTDDAEVQVTVDTELTLGAVEILRRAAQVYQGLTADEITQVESIALDRQRFFRELAV